MSRLLADNSASTCAYLPQVEKTAAAPCAEVGHCDWNFQTHAWEWETAIFEIFALSAEQTTPSLQALLATNHPDDLATTEDLLRAIRSDIRGFSYTHRIFRHDGYIRTINVEASVIASASGFPSLLRGTFNVLSDWEMPLRRGNAANASDGDLMLALRAQAPEAQAETYRRHYDSVSRLVRSTLHEYLFGDDVVQDTFESLYQTPTRFDARLGSLRTFLNMSARSRCIDAQRSQTSRRTREVVYEFCRPSHAMFEDDSLSTLSVQAMLRHLSADVRTVIELAYMEGLTYQAVAKYLDIPEGTVKARIRRGLQSLRASSCFDAVSR